MNRIARLIVVCCLASFAGIWDTPSLSAATPASGTLSTVSTSLAWTGGPYTAVTADPSLCTSLTCDQYSLTIDIPSTFYATNPSYTVRVGISWASSLDDFDLYIYDSGGNLVNSSASGGTTSESVDLGQLSTGTFQVQVVAFTTANTTYSGLATLAAPPVAPYRTAKYKTGAFSFTTPVPLLGPDDLVFGVQGLEPRSAYDALGNIYAAAIQGIPAGTDVWKSTNGGASFTYLGQPDGAQAASAIARGGGAGGGDEDIAIGVSGNVYVNSLWLGSCTQSTSFNGGATWVPNPVSSVVPGNDRQWIAAHGTNELYLTYKQLGVLLAGTESIFCVKSFDGGITFPQVTEVTTPELGVQPGDQGNIAVDQSNGNVYTIFVGQSSPNQLYVARSSDGGKTFIIKLIYQDPAGTRLSNVFPIIAVDHGSNLHAVYSTGTNIYLLSSSDQGATWTLPVRVNNGGGTKTALAPWVDAGDAGKVNITWWGTSSSNSLSDSARWNVFFAQTQNALSKTPTISENAATGVIHTGAICVNGTGCASGTRNLAEYFANTVYLDGMDMIVFPDDQHNPSPITYFTKQTGGSGVLSGKRAQTALASQEGETKARTGMIPTSYALGQNFPNPFNPTTVIPYDLPEESYVNLRVYDVFGREVLMLVDGVQGAGHRSATLDAARLPSGIYFYRLRSEKFTEMKKAVLMK
jgi:hypothetical protein